MSLGAPNIRRVADYRQVPLFLGWVNYRGKERARGKGEGVADEYLDRYTWETPSAPRPDGQL